MLSAAEAVRPLVPTRPNIRRSPIAATAISVAAGAVIPPVPAVWPLAPGHGHIPAHTAAAAVALVRRRVVPVC